QNGGSLLREERLGAQPDGQGNDAGDPMQEILLEHCHEFLSTAEATIRKGGSGAVDGAGPAWGHKRPHTVPRDQTDNDGQHRGGGKTRANSIRARRSSQRTTATRGLEVVQQPASVGGWGCDDWTRVPWFLPHCQLSFFRILPPPSTTKRKRDVRSPLLSIGS